MKFTITGRLLGLNDMTHKNRFVYGKQKKAETNRCGWAAIAGHVPKITYPVAIEIWWIEPNSRRDIDNVAAGCKFILDGLQEAQRLPNDGRKWVKALIHNFPEPDALNARVIVEIRPHSGRTLPEAK